MASRSAHAVQWLPLIGTAAGAVMSLILTPPRTHGAYIDGELIWLLLWAACGRLVGLIALFLISEFQSPGP